MPRTTFRRSLADVRRLAILTLGWGLAGIVPQRLDNAVLDLWRRIERRLRPRRVLEVERAMEIVLGSSPRDLAAEADRYLDRVAEEIWGRWRSMHGRGWNVELRVEGLERIEQGLAAGRGVIVWGMSFCGSLVPKIAMQRAGFPVVQLTAADHGASFPATPLGLRVLAPFYSLSEVRFVAERVVIPSSGSLGFMRTLIRRLDGNSCVWIAGERTSRRRNVGAPVFGTDLGFAPGAPSLAWRQGSVLLPVYARRDAPHRYTLVVQEPIACAGPDRARAVEAALGEFARRVEERVVAHPADWTWDRHTAARLLGRWPRTPA